jgi:hypothetical protein
MGTSQRHLVYGTRYTARYSCEVELKRQSIRKTSSKTKLFDILLVLLEAHKHLNDDSIETGGPVLAIGLPKKRYTLERVDTARGKVCVLRLCY